jgi:hypothetical protein
MATEDVQDAVLTKSHEVPGEELFVSDALGAAGAVMLLGPDIVTGVAGLPEWAPPHVMLVGGVLVLRALGARHLRRTGR